MADTCQGHTGCQGRCQVIPGVQVGLHQGSYRNSFDVAGLNIDYFSGFLSEVVREVACRRSAPLT